MIGIIKTSACLLATSPKPQAVCLAAKSSLLVFKPHQLRCNPVPTQRHISSCKFIIILYKHPHCMVPNMCKSSTSTMVSGGCVVRFGRSPNISHPPETMVLEGDLHIFGTMQWVFTVMAPNSYKWDYNSCRLRFCNIIYHYITSLQASYNCYGL